MSIPPLPPEAYDRTPPGLPNAPLATTEDLKVGDVVQVSTQLVDRQTGQPFWWKRFVVVKKLARPRKGVYSKHFTGIHLKMHPDFDKDERIFSLIGGTRDEPQIVTKLEEPWPQGVTAMYMKYITLGYVKLHEED